MFCAIYKWFISQAKDSRKPLSAFAIRHIGRCASCREFVNLHESLMETSVRDLVCLPSEKESALARKIISALDRNGGFQRIPPRRSVLVPVIVSAFVFMAVATGIYFLTAPQPNSAYILNSLSEIDETISSFEERLEKIHSPLDAEYADLEQTMRSTTEFFASYLDVKIGQGAE